MDVKDRNEVKFNPHEQKTRYIESRQIERGLLETLESVYRCSMEGDSSEKSGMLESAKDTLELNLEQKYNSWQSFYNDRPGLNSGGAGEAFTRMVGSKILEDFPDVNKIIPGEAINYGTNISLQPRNESDKGIVEVTVRVKSVPEYKFAKFVFSTSIVEIERRWSVITDEIETARKKTDEDFNNF